MKRFLMVVLSLIAAISLTVFVFAVKFRMERHSWVITTAEITFIGLPEGAVFGTFTDYNGKVHSEYSMYADGRFQKQFNPISIDYKTYLGRTVRIMYDPSTIDSEGAYTTTDEKGETVAEHKFIEIESYDNYLRRFIVSGIVFIASFTPVAVVWVKAVRKRKAKISEKQI